MGYSPLSRKRFRSSTFGKNQESCLGSWTKAMKTSTSEFSEITDSLRRYCSSNVSKSSSQISIDDMKPVQQLSNCHGRLHNPEPKFSKASQPSDSESFFSAFAPTRGDRKPRVERKGNGVVKIIL